MYIFSNRVLARKGFFKEKTSGTGRIRSMAAGLVLVFLCTFLSGCKTKEDLEAQLAAKDAGIAALAASDYAGAVDSFNEALTYADNKITGVEYDICLYKAAAQYAEGDLEGAIDTYTSLMGFDNRPEPAFLRGSVYAANNEIHRALSDYKEAVTRDPDNYDLYIAIYRNLSAQHYEDQADNYLAMALNIQGDSGKHELNRGRIYLLQGKLDAAESALLRARDKKEASANGYLTLVRVQKGDFGGAADALTAYKNTEGLGASDYLLIAQVELETGNDAAALLDYEAGIALADGGDRMTMERGVIAALERLARWPEAYERAAAYVSAYPQDIQMARELQFLQSTVLGTENEWLLSYGVSPEDASSEKPGSDSGDADGTQTAEP